MECGLEQSCDDVAAGQREDEARGQHNVVDCHRYLHISRLSQDVNVRKMKFFLALFLHVVFASAAAESPSFTGESACSL